MAHAHHHAGESASAYFTEQLLTILVCLLFGITAVQLYLTGALEYLLAPQFRPWVLVGGVAVLVLVAIRAVAVWNEAGELRDRAACAADHDHGPDCGHDHHHHDGDDHDHGADDHGHSHDMSWVFARMLILLFPVLLFFTVPAAGFSNDAQLQMVGKESALGAGGLKDVAAKSGTVLRFNDLNDAAFDEAKRQSMEGQTATLVGRFKRVGDKEFTLFRLKMTCCAADTVPLKVRIVVPQAVNNIPDATWVKVTGQIQFLKVPGGKAGAETYIPVIKVADNTDVVPNVPAQNEYEQ